MTTHSIRKCSLIAPLIVTLMVTAMVIPATVWGRSRYGNRRGVSAPSTAQVTAAQRQVAQASGQLKLAQAHFRSQTRQLMMTRQEVQKDHSQDGSFVSAHRQWDDSKKELTSARGPVLDKLKSYSSEYKTLLKDRDLLKHKLSESDYETDSEREAMLKKYSAAISRIAQLEKEAIYADEKAATLQKQVDEHDSHYRDLVKKREADIDNDSRLVSAKQSIIAAKAEVDKADTQLAVAQQQLASAQLNYQRQLSAYANRRSYRRY